MLMFRLQLQAVAVTCSVEANPASELQWSWSFNNSLNSHEMPVQYSVLYRSAVMCTALLCRMVRWRALE